MMMKREQLELVIQKRKLNEIYNWFEEHFVKSTRIEYLSRCPFVILQGPTGSGKSSTIKWISAELKAPIKEYSETTDVTAINYDLARVFSEEDKTNLSQSINRRKALKFEYFVVNTLRYNTLYPANDLIPPDADAEFSDDDMMDEQLFTQPPKPPPVSGVIIHIETPLSFAQSQRILIQTLCRLLKIIKEVSRSLSRRVAIVFESLEGEGETLTLPTKMKLSLGMQVFKFNPITRANMKKLIEFTLKGYQNVVLDKDTIEQLVNDCDGDMRACLNTLQLICECPSRASLIRGISSEQMRDCFQYRNSSPIELPLYKKQKLNHEKARQIKLNPSLMRDTTKSLALFHVLGKIFYQKRLYPLAEAGRQRVRRFRKVERPYPPENSTEHLRDMLSVEPKNLIAWLHQHYYKFCEDSDLEKASEFLENLSTCDTVSLNALQSSQFYESHNAIDQLQTHLAIESTVYSLYEDQSAGPIKTSHKKLTSADGVLVVKPSVAKNGPENELYSFNKPLVIGLPKLLEDHQVLLDRCVSFLLESELANLNPTKVLLDYIPYLNHMTKKLASTSNSRTIPKHSIFDDKNLLKIISILDNVSDEFNPDIESRHEKLLEIIELD